MVSPPILHMLVSILKEGYHEKYAFFFGYMPILLSFFSFFYMPILTSYINTCIFVFKKGIKIILKSQ